MYQFKMFLKKSEYGGYIVTVPSLPGCVAFGEDIPQAIKMAEDAIQ